MFTERREIVQTTNSAEMRDKLMESIKLAIENSQAIDVEARSADELMAELVGYDPVGNHESENDDQFGSQSSLEQGADPCEIDNSSTPLTPDPQFSASGSEADLHSIPHIESPQESKKPHPDSEK